MTQQRKYYLHSRHIWTGGPPEDSGPNWTVTDETTRVNSFIIPDIRKCLVLKLDGFVQEHKAKVVSVSEDSLRLQVGGSWLGSILSKTSCPLDLEIRFRPAETAHNPHSEVEVIIHDRRFRRETSRFEAAARRVILQLKEHLMAIQ